MVAFPASSPAASRACNLRSPLRSVITDFSGQCDHEDVYADAHARISQWRKDLAISAGLDAQRGLSELRRDLEDQKALHADLAGLQGLVVAASQLQAGGARLAQVLQHSGEATAERALAMGCITDEVFKLHDEQKQDIQEMEFRNSQKKQAADAQHVEALKLLGTYTARLGLAISRVAAQTVRIAFSLLDDCNIGQESFFVLGLVGSDKVMDDPACGNTLDRYCVDECVPHVMGVPELLAELNAHSASSIALPRFVCSMRRAFLEVARKSCAT